MRAKVQSAFDAPAYTGRLAAHYVGVPYQTMRSWIGPIGLINTPRENILSFNNLAEAHVLKAMRKSHKLSMQSIRRALGKLSQLRSTPHPLLDETFGTNGVDLCIYEQDQVVNLTQELQTEIKDFVALYLQRIERDSTGRATRLYPFIAKGDDASEPRHITITPTVSFGRSVLTGTGISTALIAGRFAARDSVESLAKEYEVEPGVLEDAIRWEMLKGRAA